MIPSAIRAGVIAALILVLLSASPARGEQPQAALEQRIERLEKLLEQTRAELAAVRAAPAADAAKLAEIERQIDILSREIEKLKLGEAAAPAPASPTGAYGVGPAAAKVYSAKPGVSIGGYGEALYQNFSAKNQSGEASFQDDQVTLLRAVVYLGYKLRALPPEHGDRIRNAVVASDKGDEAEVEFAYIDYSTRVPSTRRWPGPDPDRTRQHAARADDSLARCGRTSSNGSSLDLAEIDFGGYGEAGP